MQITFGKAIEFIREHPEFGMKLPSWEDKYIKWDWSSYTEVNAVTTRLVLVEEGKEPIEWIPTTGALINPNWVIFVY